MLKTDLCKAPAKCRNTEGDYKCECPIGYQLNATNDCVGKCKLLSQAASCRLFSYVTAVASIWLHLCLLRDVTEQPNLVKT